jgi:hypothetical protein
MNTSMRTRSIVAVLVAGAIAPAAPAAASLYSPVGEGPQATKKDDSAAIVLRRDGSQATPFVADVSPEAAVSGDGFDWGDAAIGAGAGLLTVALVVGGSGAIAGRRRPTPTPASAASQGA